MNDDLEQKLDAIFFEGLDSYKDGLECPFDTKTEHTGKGTHRFSKPTEFHQMEPATEFASGTDVGDMTPDLAEKKDFEKLQEELVKLSNMNEDEQKNVISQPAQDKIITEANRLFDLVEQKGKNAFQEIATELLIEREAHKWWQNRAILAVHYLKNKSKTSSEADEAGQ